MLLHGNQLFQEFKGAYAENYVAQTLHKQHIATIPNQGLFYWTREGAASEIDFIIELSGNIYPIEVKSGESTKQKSLTIYWKIYNPKLAIRVSPQNLLLDGSFLNLPFYLLPHMRELLSQF